MFGCPPRMLWLAPCRNCGTVFLPATRSSHRLRSLLCNSMYTFFIFWLVSVSHQSLPAEELLWRGRIQPEGTQSASRRKDERCRRDMQICCSILRRCCLCGVDHLPSPRPCSSVLVETPAEIVKWLWLSVGLTVGRFCRVFFFLTLKYDTSSLAASGWIAFRCCIPSWTLSSGSRAKASSCLPYLDLSNSVANFR